MERDSEKVRQELYRRVLGGGVPKYNFESCVDNWCDWFVLSEREFNRIKQQALAERDKLLRERQAEIKLVEKKAAFWVAMKYFTPIFVAVALAFWGYMLIYFIIPIARAERDNEHLEQQIIWLNERTEKIQQKQIDIIEQIARVKEGNMHLARENAKLNQGDQLLRQELSGLLRPVEKLQSEIQNLRKEHRKQEKYIEILQQETERRNAGL